MSGESRKGGSERARFVTRARTLKEDRSFQQDCERVISDWNQSFPEFGIRSERTLPPEEHGLAPEEYLLPPLLHRIRSFAVGVAGRDDRLQDRTATLKQRDSSITDPMKVIRAKQVWRTLVSTMCEQYWPHVDFPHRLNCLQHPAHHFAAGCLVWRPEFVSEEWILQPQSPVYMLPFDPRDKAVNGNPVATEWQTRYEVILDSVRDLIEQKGAVLANDLPSILAAVERAASEAHEESEISQQHYPVLLIYPGISSEVLRKNASMVAENLREQFDIKKRARQLEAEGYEKAEIARRLGVDRKTIYNWLPPENVGSGCDFPDKNSQRHTG